MLLRSPQSETFATRVDVLFTGVETIKLPTVLHGLTVAIARGSRAAALATEAGLVPDEDNDFYTLDGADFSGYVVAAAVMTCEDVGEYFEPSEVWPHPMTPF